MSTDVPEAIPAPPGRKSRVAAALAAVGAAALAVGAVLALQAGEGQVASIRVTKHSIMPESIIMGSPDYYLTVGTRAGKTITTKGYEDTPIGNGLDFKLPHPLALEDVAHVELMDADVGGDDMRDRVDVRERISKGQDYQIELIGPASPRKTTGYVALAAGGALVVLAAILWVRSHAI
jgi:hypothetical protein